MHAKLLGMDADELAEEEEGQVCTPETSSLISPNCLNSLTLLISLILLTLCILLISLI